MYYALTDYPIKEMTATIDSVQKESWVQINAEVEDHRQRRTATPPAMICLDHFVSIFSHLTLDQDYSIFAYVTNEFHGTVGRVSAIKHGEFNSATVSGLVSRWKVNLPDNAVNPMEVVYCDGTPEGYLEAVLLEKMFLGFPLTKNIYSDSETVLFERPSTLDAKWDMLFEVQRWTPVVKDSSLYLYMYKSENSLEASDGLDSISLCCYHFSDCLGMSRALSLKTNYPLTLADLPRRYIKGKHCCVFSRTSITIAKQI